MEGIKEYADEPVVYECPSNMPALLASKAIKDRLSVLNYLVQEIASGNITPALQVAELAPFLVKEQNQAALSKSMQVVDVILQNGALYALQILEPVLEHAASMKYQIKDSVKRVAMQAAYEDLEQTLAILYKFSGNKQAKLVAEVSGLLSQVLETQEPSLKLLQCTLPFIVHSSGDVRKAVIDRIVYYGYALGKQCIVSFLKQKGISEQVIATFENQIADQYEVRYEANVPQNTGKFEYDDFDDNYPVRFYFPKGFEDKMKNPNWKERKQALEDAIEMLKNVPKIESFDVSKFGASMRILISEEKTVYVVQLAMKLLGLIAIKMGSLGSVKQIQYLLQTVQNRTKEKKYAIVNGYHIFVESILVRSYNFGQIQNELFYIAIPHKNLEVKEELLRLIKVCCATYIIYYLKMADEDRYIDILSNDAFPNPIFPNTEEYLPANGEKSFGMQLNSKVWRQKCASNLVFVQFFLNGNPNTDRIQFPADLYLSFFDNVDKLLNDTNNGVRELAYRAVALFVAANILEGSDAIYRSQESQNIIEIYNQMYQCFIQFFSYTRRRAEIQAVVGEISKFINVTDPFSSLFDYGNFAQLPSFQKPETCSINRQIMQTKVTNMLAAQQPESTQPVSKPSQIQQLAKPEQRQIAKQGKQSSTYDQRMAQRCRIIVDANNSKAPITIYMVEELYTNLSLLSSQAYMFFMKDVIKAPFGCQGNFNWVKDNISILLDCDLSQYRDISLTYLSLIISDGFLVKSQVSPIHIRLFYDSVSALVANLQKQSIYLNKYDLECIIPVILQKLEQQSTASARYSIFKVFELILSVSFSLEEMIIICLRTVSKHNKVYIRQITTKVAILRLVAGLCFEFQRYGMHFVQMAPIHLSGLQQFYLNKQAENYTLTDSSITKLVPSGVQSQKQLSSYVANTIMQCCPHEMQGKLLQSCQKFMREEDLSPSMVQPGPQFAQCFPPAIYNQPSMRAPVQYSRVMISYQPYQSFTAAPQSYSQQQTLLKYPPAQQPCQLPEYQPYYSYKTPEKAEAHVEADLLDFPETLVDVPYYPSPMSSRRFYKIIETPNLQDIIRSQENYKYSELCNLQLRQDNARYSIDILKALVHSLREEQSNIYLESQVEKLSLKVIEIVQFFVFPYHLAQGPDDTVYGVAKYAIMALACLGQTELFHYSHVYKKMLLSLLPVVSLFATTQGRSYSYSKCYLIIGIFQGFLLELADVSDIFRLSAALLQIVCQLIEQRYESSMLSIIARNYNTENYQFVYCFVTSMIYRIQPQLTYDLQREIGRRVKIASELTNSEVTAEMEPQLRQEMVQYWNGADQFMFQLHIIQLSGSFQVIDQILRSLNDEVVFIMGKVPEQSSLRKKLKW